MTRRGALLALLAGVLAKPVHAEEARHRPRIRQRRHSVPPRETIAPLPTPQVAIGATIPQAEAAPVPNREIEAPNRGYSMQARLMPDIFRARMPGRTANTDGVINQREERVFTPGAGARLTLPFFTR